MEKQEVIDLMSSSKSDREWNTNCDTVKKKCNGYPSWWYPEIILSGLAGKILGSFGASDEITVS